MMLTLIARAARAVSFCRTLPLAAALALVSAGGLAGQMVLPDSFTNLKVLPKDISRDKLLGTMRSFSAGLGVRCDYCHAEDKKSAGGAPTQGPPKLNFASDDKDQKKIARGMLRMVAGINAQYLGKIKELDKDHVQVSCITCHHGVSMPRTLADVLAEDVAQKGVAAAIKHYKQLKTTYYGSGAYDFREGSLEDLARQLTGSDKIDDALAILDLAGEEFPQSGMVPFLQGEALLKKGDRPAAIARFRRALELQPQNPMIRRRLTELGET